MATRIVHKCFSRTPRSLVRNSTRLFSSNHIENEDHIAIDLGDANYRVAVMEGQTARIVDVSPAVIAFNEKGEYVFGTKAVQQRITHPKTMVYGINRLLGRKFDDPFVQTEMKRVLYNIVKGSDGDACVEVYGKVYTPSSIRAGILNNIMKNAESYVGKPVCNAIISLPAHCKGENEVLGGEKTMMEVLYESDVAGAQMNIFYGICPIVSSGLIKKEGIVAILDMGSRTFSASILEMTDHSRVWLTKYNDMFLGGEDFDNALMEYLMSEFKSSEAIDLKGDHAAVQRLRKASEKAKMELSYLLETEVNLPYITTAASGGKHLNVTVARSTFERLAEDLVQRVKSACENCLEEAGISSNDVDEVLLVGGMSRVPKVKTSVTEIFGKSPRKMRNPDEAVALGAAELIEARVLPRDMWKQVREVTKSAHTIEGKCIFHTFKNYTKLDNVGAEDYFCRFEYKASTGGFTPDRVAVYCKCEMPYNPDDLMIQCEACKDWGEMGDQS